jgi:hypothetical protein
MIVWYQSTSNCSSSVTAPAEGGVTDVGSVVLLLVSFLDRNPSIRIIRFGRRAFNFG